MSNISDHDRDEFLAAVSEASNEVWVPQPEEWYIGIVTRIGEKDYSFAVLSTGTEVFVHSKSVRFRPGAHVCLRVGDEVALRIKPPNKSGRNYVALECVLQTPREEKAESDTGVITFWSDRGHGYIKRACGCYLLVPKSDDHFQVGDLVSFTISRTRNMRCDFYQADNVERVAGDNNDER